MGEQTAKTVCKSAMNIVYSTTLVFVEVEVNMECITNMLHALECNIIEEIRDCLQCRWQIREFGKTKTCASLRCIAGE